MCIFRIDGTTCPHDNNWHGNATAPRPLNLCEGHFLKVCEAIRAAQPALSTGEVADFARIHCIVQDSAFMNAALSDLGDRLTDFVANHAADALVRESYFPPLHWTLKAVEERYGFTRDCVMTGILEPKAFLTSLNGRYIVLDFGAGADHGAFTHRFQWYAVMWAASGGALDGTQRGEWRNGLDQLWVRLGSTDAGGRTGLPRGGGEGIEHGSSLWAALFDKGGNGNYCHPNSLHAAIRAGHCGNAALRQAVLDMQRLVVGRRVQVIEKLMNPGWWRASKARYGNLSSTDRSGARDGEDRSDERVAERDDLIEAAVAGRALSRWFRFKRGERWVSSRVLVDPADAEAGNFYDLVQTKGAKLLVKEIKRHGWVKQAANLYVRRNPVRINDHLAL